MRFRSVRSGATVLAVGGLLAGWSGLAAAQAPAPLTPPTQSPLKQVNFAAQGASIKQLTAATQITKDEEAPARAFSGPTSMAVDPKNPRIVVVATANLRNKTCYLSVSKDAGHTWHFSKTLPEPTAFPDCTNATAGVPQASLAWGRDGTLYYAHQAYDDGEGQSNASIMLAKTTDLGVHWTYTMVDNLRGMNTSATPPGDTGVTGLAVDTSGPKDVVSVGFSRSYANLPADSPMRNPILMVATSLDAGATFGAPVNLNTFDRPSITLAGKTYQLYLRTGFGAPFLTAHDGVLLAVAGPALPFNDQPATPPEAGANLSPGTWYAYPMPQLIGRSTDHGKTWTITTLGDPIYAGTGSMTGLGWTAKGGPKGTYLAAYAATAATSNSTSIENIVVQRSTDGGLTWTPPLVIDDDPPAALVTSFYPQMSVAPNGRVDVAWQDDGGQTDFNFNVRYTYSTDGGATWAHNVKVSDQNVNWNYGVSFNSDIRQPSGVASTNQYAIFGWADTRLADDNSQTQDNFSTLAQFSALPSTKNTTAPKIAAVFAGLIVAGVVLLVILQIRRRREGPPSAPAQRREPVGAR